MTRKARFARGEREAEGMGRWNGEHQGHATMDLSLPENI